MKKQTTAPVLLVIDLFCGAGGVTTGFEKARIRKRKIVKTIACVNHDTLAIESHAANHKHVKHFVEDIQTLDISELLRIVNYWRAKYPNAKLALWASLECTNFSKAKGGLPRDADSRTLAESLYRYIELLGLDYIMIENVVEFMSWGKLDASGKPVSKHAGQDYLKWMEKIKRYGYDFQHRVLNAADYGAHTTRKRFFGIFARPGLPMFFPEPTHAKEPAKTDLFSAPLKKWKPVKEVLDFSDEGNSIFIRKKPLSEKTLARIFAGLIKYIAGGKENFVAKIYAVGSKSHGTYHTDRPGHSITTRDAAALIQTKFMMQNNNGWKPEGMVTSVNHPARTITCTGGNLNIVTPQFLIKYYGTNKTAHGIDAPADTLTTKDRLAKVETYWLDKHYSGEANHGSIHQPAGTVLTKDKYALMEAEHFISRQFSSGQKNTSIEKPAGSLLTVPKMQLVRAEKAFVMRTSYNACPSGVNDPCPTVLASRKHHYLVNPQWGVNSGGSINKPCFTIIARMDKTPPYLVTTEHGELAIQCYESDSEMTVKIKEFMAAYGIVDIKMRMLKIMELLGIQGFPKGYTLKGNQSEQKKFIGNAQPPIVVQRWAEALCGRLIELFELKKAA